jgi:2-keto-4-pentenoate hydratase
VVEFDLRLLEALRAQLQGRRNALHAGARHIGWKLGTGRRERIGDGPVLGHLTSTSELRNGGTYRATRDALLHADAEVALEIGKAAEVLRYGAALERVDLGGSNEAEQIVASNVFHRAVAFGPFGPCVTNDVVGRLIVNGHERARAPVRHVEYGELADEVGQLLAELGEELAPGDRLITGAVVQVPVAAGDLVVADLGPLGRAELRIDSAKG